MAAVNVDSESEAFEEATERKPERQLDSESEVPKEAITRKPGHHKEVKERNKPTEALKEVIERNPGCREGSACAGKICCSCVARPF